MGSNLRRFLLTHVTFWARPSWGKFYRSRRATADMGVQGRTSLGKGERATSVRSLTGRFCGEEITIPREVCRVRRI